MRQTMNKLNRMQWLAVVVLMAVADAAAQNRGVRQPDRQVVVSIPERKLALIEDGQVVKIYTVAVGADVSPSPDGEFKIVNRVEKPTYYHKGKVIPSGRSNPLGTRWIGLSEPHYGIHGTNEPWSIGKAASHGCIRMAHKDLEELFTLVRPGDTVIIRAEEDELTSRIFGSTTPILAQSQFAAAGQAAGGSR
jgi:lipoprotein-anchoring transpeptidase ErfK/SrfK